MVAGLVLAVALTAVTPTDDHITRHELEARTHYAEQRVGELKEQLDRSLEAIEKNQAAIAENQRTIADLRGRLAVWGTILTIVTGSGLLFHVFSFRKKE